MPVLQGQFYVELFLLSPTGRNDQTAGLYEGPQSKLVQKLYDIKVLKKLKNKIHLSHFV
jgi:hypothetical protein